MLRVWNATKFIFLSDECPGLKVTTPTYKGTVIITWQDNEFYSVNFRDIELKIHEISSAEKALDAVKDFVENGEVLVRFYINWLIRCQKSNCSIPIIIGIYKN